MNIPFTGGCACGAVRYECDAEPIVMFNCHCRDCQRISGGGFAPVVYVPLKAFRFTKGSLHYYGTPSLTGGHNKRGFCPQCGSRISGGESSQGIGLTAASLDDPSQFRSQFHIFVADAQPWDHPEPDIPQFDQYAPS
jgi:hypothetical protein